MAQEGESAPLIHPTAPGTHRRLAAASDSNLFLLLAASPGGRLVMHLRWPPLAQAHRGRKILDQCGQASHVVLAAAAEGSQQSAVCERHRRESQHRFTPKAHTRRKPVPAAHTLTLGPRGGATALAAAGAGAFAADCFFARGGFACVYGKAGQGKGMERSLFQQDGTTITQWLSHMAIPHSRQHPHQGVLAAPLGVGAAMPRTLLPQLTAFCKYAGRPWPAMWESNTSRKFLAAATSQSQ